MRSRIWRCPTDGYLRITPSPSDSPVCPLCRGRCVDGPPASTVELVPIVPDDARVYFDRLMREKPGH